MSRRVRAIYVFILLAAFVSCRPHDQARDEAAIRQFIDQFAQTENSRDGEKLSLLFAPDGEAVVQNEAIASGRDAIRKGVTPRLPWSEMGPATYKVRRIRFVNPDIALVDAQRAMFSSTFVRSSAVLFILRRRREGWRVESYRSASEKQPPLADSPFASGK
jgi:uncharacterized protein (TIGR02246 family)